MKGSRHSGSKVHKRMVGSHVTTKDIQRSLGWCVPCTSHLVTVKSESSAGKRLAALAVWMLGHGSRLHTDVTCWKLTGMTSLSLAKAQNLHLLLARDEKEAA